MPVSPLLRTLLAVFLSAAALADTFAQSTLVPITTRRGLVFDHAGNHLYVAASDGTVQAYNLNTHQVDATYNAGSSLNGIDIAPDDSFLLVAENSTGIAQGVFYRINLSDGSITNVAYPRTDGEGGAWDVAIGSNGLALITTQYEGSGWVPLRQINLANNTVSVRTDAPGSGFGGQVTQNTRIARSADRTRMYLMESNISNGPAFTYSAPTNSFGSSVELDTFLDSAGAAVNRDGSILGTRLDNFPYLGATNTSLDGAAGLEFIHGSSGMNGGVAFDAVQDIFYTIGNGGTQIIATSTTSFQEVFRFTIGETVSGNVTPFGTGTMVASQDGRFVALETPSGIRLFNTTHTSGVPTPTFNSPRGMVFDHSGRFLYIATYDGFVWRYDLVTNLLVYSYYVGGSLNGIDIAPDDSFLLISQAVVGIKEGAFQKLDLAKGEVTNFAYPRAFYEAGGWSVALTSRGTALGTTVFAGSGWVPVHQINLGDGTLSTRGDAPGSGGAGQITGQAQLQRSADQTRLFFLETDISSGPLFTYSATSDTFGSAAETDTFLDNASAAVNRDGSLVGAQLSGQSSASLDTAASFNFVHSFNAVDSGVAFDATRDIFYGVKSSTDQIVGFSTTTFGQKVTLQIGENVSSGASQFGAGTMVASQDGRYLALQTPTTIRIYAIPPSSGPALQLTGITRLSNGHIVLQGFSAPNGSNTVQATTNLRTSFGTIGSAPSDLNGVVHFEDANANPTTGFYRLTSP